VKQIRSLGLMVVVVFAMPAAASSTASALEWLDNGHPITNPVLVLAKTIGQLELADLAATGGAVVLLCEGRGHGTVGPGANDTIKSIEVTSCSFEAGKNGSCEASKSVTGSALNLPWATRLLTVGGVTHDMIENSGVGVPGWRFECAVAGIFKVQDECHSEARDPRIDNNAFDVTALFEASETGSCSLGTSTSGMLVGSILIFSSGPLKISVSP